VTDVNNRITTPSGGRAGGFTLIELMVAVAIITLILLAVVPSVTSMWDQRKLSDTETLIRGALINARQRAIGVRETGLLFYVDPDGVQRVVPIEQAELMEVLPPNPPDIRLDLLSVDRFAVIKGGEALTIPPPIRVTPRTVLLADPDGSRDYERYNDDELLNENFLDPPPSANSGQRHRNYFSIVFSTEGQLIVGRDVLIYDADLQAGQKGSPGEGLGDLTGLPVKRVRRYYPRVGNNAEEIYPVRGRFGELRDVVADPTPAAINFPSVDGVLVYDDSLFRRSGAAVTRRDFLAETGRPYYVNRVTGEIIRGPVAENEDPKG